MSLINMIAQAITPSLISQVGSMLGANSSVVQKGLSAAIPGVLSAITSTTKSSLGADAFGKLLGQIQPGFLDTATSQLGQNPQAVASQGQNMLGTLLGSGQIDSLAGKLTDYAGLPSNTGGSLLGVASSLVMGTLGKKAKEQNLDTQGALGLLDQHRDEIARAMPADFARSLEGTGLLDAFSDKMGLIGSSADQTFQAFTGAAGDAASATAETAGDAAQAVGSAAAAAGTTVREAAADTAERVETAAKKRPGWLIPALAAAAVIALLIIAYNIFAPGEEQVAEQVEEAEEAVTEAVDNAGEVASDAADQAAEVADDAAQAVSVDGAVLAESFRSSFAELSKSLESVDSAAAAEDLLPNLTEARDRLSELESTVGNMSAETRATLAQIVEDEMPALREAADTALANGEVSNVLKPVVDAIIERLNAIGNA
ncbi:MAG: DUF937 domain-containing protein [Geminicoccaceae bacterium]